MKEVEHQLEALAPQLVRRHVLGRCCALLEMAMRVSWCTEKASQTAYLCRYWLKGSQSRWDEAAVAALCTLGGLYHTLAIVAVLVAAEVYR